MGTIIIVIATLYCLASILKSESTSINNRPSDEETENLRERVRARYGTATQPNTSKNSPIPQTKSNPYGIHLPPPKNAEAAREASRAQTPGYKPPPALSQSDKEQIYVIIRNSLYENGILKGSNDYSLQQGRYAAVISEISKEVVEYINNKPGEK